MTDVRKSNIQFVQATPHEATAAAPPSPQSQVVAVAHSFDISHFRDKSKTKTTAHASAINPIMSGSSNIGALRPQSNHILELCT